LGGYTRAARRRLVLTVAVTGALLSGCGLLGGTTAQLQHTPVITVTSPMVEQGTIANRYTCHGAGESPPLSWSGVPAAARSVALVVDDASAPITPRLYWIVYNVSPATVDIQAGRLPNGALEARNSSGKTRYSPPCPAGKSHKYRFTVYALNTTLPQRVGRSIRAAWSTIARHVIARGRLTAAATP
jgi:hypothetical protein